MTEPTCPGCLQPIDSCFYGGDCLEVRAIRRVIEREKLRDIDPDEIECDVCGRTYGEYTHDQCHGYFNDEDF